MDPMILDLNSLAVETFVTSTPDATLTPTQPVGGMKTYEPGCTTPELCPNNTTVPVAA